jgi:hypothetical protein
VTYGVWYCGGLEYNREDLRGDLWCLVLQCGLNIIGKV